MWLKMEEQFIKDLFEKDLTKSGDEKHF